MLLEDCWLISVLGCSTGVAQEAGLAVAAHPFPDVLRVCPGAPAMLHKQGNVTRDTALKVAALAT